MCAASAYESVVTRHGLGEVLAGSDWQVTALGGLDMTADGNPKFGDARCNAMHRLVLRWCSNARVLETLLDLVAVDNLRKHNAKAEREAIVCVSFATEFPSTERIEKFHALGEEVETGEFGGATCAGAIMVVLNNLLQRYKTDLRELNPKWGGIGPQFNGYSLGEVIEAASNNFRHHDEWARAKEPTKQQMKSIPVLKAALGYARLSAAAPPWRRNACADLVAVVIGETEFATLEQRFATLEQRFFKFAKAMLGRT
jgi:hypothetical protein